jgi:hypothetical protein
VIICLGFFVDLSLPHLNTKFINVKSPALIAKLKLMEAALLSVASLEYAKSYLAGKLSGGDTLYSEYTNIKCLSCCALECQFALPDEYGTSKPN